MRSLACILVGLCGCTAVSLDGEVFACRDDDECARGTVCDPLRGLCVPPEARSDAGPAPDVGVLPDAGPPTPVVSACFPELSATTTATDHWWCHGMRGSEVQVFLDRVGGKVLDVEVEPGSSDEPRYSVALARKADGRRAAWVHETPLMRELETGIRAIDYGLRTTVPRGELRAAASYELSLGSRYYGDAAATEMLVSDIADLLFEANWNPPYGGRVIDIDRWMLRGREVYAWTLRIRGIDRATQIHLFVDGQELRALARSNTVLDVEDDLVPGRYNVVTATRTDADPAARFIEQLSADALNAELADGRDHVARLVPVRAPDLRWSALLVRTPTTTVARVRAEVSDTASGTAGVLLPSTSSTAQRGVDLELRYRSLPNTLVALMTLDRIASGATDLDAFIPDYGGACPFTANSTITVRAALEGVLIGAEPNRLLSLMRQLDARRIAGAIAQLQLTETEVRGTPGCRDDASTTSLRDQGRILAALAAHPLQPQLAPLMLGSATTGGGELDLWDGPSVIDQMVEEEATRLGVSAAVRAAFRAGVALSFTRTQSQEGGVNLTLAAMAEVPACDGPLRVSQRWLYATSLRNSMLATEVNRAVALVRAEPLREVLRDGLASAAACLP